MPSTVGDRIQIPVPDLDESPDGPDAFTDAFTALNTKVALDDQGALASRPVSTAGTPGIRGRYYFVTGDPDPAQNGILWRDNGIGWDEIAVRTPFVTALPASPSDGQEIAYEASLAALVYWRLQYNAALNRWLFQGGPPLYAAAASLAVAYKGTYLVQAEANVQASGNFRATLQILLNGAAQLTRTSDWNSLGSGFDPTRGTVTAETIVTATATAATVSVSAAPGASGYLLKVLPVALTP